jgi:hypothetical protein
VAVVLAALRTLAAATRPRRTEAALAARLPREPATDAVVEIAAVALGAEAVVPVAALLILATARFASRRVVVRVLRRAIGPAVALAQAAAGSGSAAARAAVAHAARRGPTVRARCDALATDTAAEPAADITVTTRLARRAARLALAAVAGEPSARAKVRSATARAVLAARLPFSAAGAATTEDRRGAGAGQRPPARSSRYDALAARAAASTRAGAVRATRLAGAAASYESPAGADRVRIRARLSWSDALVSYDVETRSSRAGRRAGTCRGPRHAAKVAVVLGEAALVRAAALPDGDARRVVLAAARVARRPIAACLTGGATRHADVRVEVARVSADRAAASATRLSRPTAGSARSGAGPLLARRGAIARTTVSDASIAAAAAAAAAPTVGAARLVGGAARLTRHTGAGVPTHVRGRVAGVACTARLIQAAARLACSPAADLAARGTHAARAARLLRAPARLARARRTGAARANPTLTARLAQCAARLALVRGASEPGRATAVVATGLPGAAARRACVLRRADFRRRASIAHRTARLGAFDRRVAATRVARVAGAAGLSGAAAASALAALAHVTGGACGAHRTTREVAGIATTRVARVAGAARASGSAAALAQAAANRFRCGALRVVAARLTALTASGARSGRTGRPGRRAIADARRRRRAALLAECAATAAATAEAGLPVGTRAVRTDASAVRAAPAVVASVTVAARFARAAAGAASKAGAGRLRRAAETARAAVFAELAAGHAVAALANGVRVTDVRSTAGLAGSAAIRACVERRAAARAADPAPGCQYSARSGASPVSPVVGGSARSSAAAADAGAAAARTRAAGSTPRSGTRRFAARAARVGVTAVVVRLRARLELCFAASAEATAQQRSADYQRARSTECPSKPLIGD